MKDEYMIIIDEGISIANTANIKNDVEDTAPCLSNQEHKGETSTNVDIEKVSKNYT